MRWRLLAVSLVLGLFHHWVSWNLPACSTAAHYSSSDKDKSSQVRHTGQHSLIRDSFQSSWSRQKSVGNGLVNHSGCCGHNQPKIHHWLRWWEREGCLPTAEQDVAGCRQSPKAHAIPFSLAILLGNKRETPENKEKIFVEGGILQWLHTLRIHMCTKPKNR